MGDPLLDLQIGANGAGQLTSEPLPGLGEVLHALLPPGPELSQRRRQSIMTHRRPIRRCHRAGTETGDSLADSGPDTVNDAETSGHAGKLRAGPVVEAVVPPISCAIANGQWSLSGE
jgi:hypothetical protein